MKEIVLASASPRRKEILDITGLKFIVDTTGYKENMDYNLTPHKLAKFLSLEKAKAVRHKYKSALIIAADTFIVHDDKLLGKPYSENAARMMLRSLSGSKHSVITGFTIIDTASGKIATRFVETRVFFRKITKHEIESYIKSGEPMDKAGAYAIQGLGALFIKKIEGDYFNVMGLPLGALMESLKKFGIYVL